MIIGHERIVKFFDNAIKNGGIGHAYCLVGSNGIGKLTLANYISGQVLETEENKLSTNPDYCYLERATDEKTGKLKKDISVKQARALRERLQSSSWLGKGQAIVINEAELLSIEAANALLKVLEEPPKKSIIFLLTTDDNLLLPTIRSRCQTFYLSSVNDAELEKSLKDLGAEVGLAGEIVKMAWGRPGRAISALNDVMLRQSYRDEITRVHNLIALPFYGKVAALEDLFGKKDDDHISKRDHWKTVLDIWQMEFRNILCGKSSWSQKFSQKQITIILDKIKLAQDLMGKNINPRLIIEEILFNF